MPKPFQGKIELGVRDSTPDWPAFSLCGEGRCIGYDGIDKVAEYPPRFESSGGEIVKVVLDVADDADVDVERHLAASLARD